MTDATAEKETHEFKAELKQLLHLITHSLYSNREIFLRELISNASDAINKIRFDSLEHEERLEGNKDWKIEIAIDKDAGTLIIQDNGIGMSRETVVKDLGTIARSGTKAFLENLKAASAANRPDLIGQFGVGFYSAFMVADKVTVLTREAGDPTQGTRWESDGQGAYTLEPFEKPTRGTDVIVHLKEDAKEFLEPYRLRTLITKFSDFIEHPIVMDVEKEGENQQKTVSQETLNKRKAIWLRAKNEVTPEEYEEFYKQLSHDSEGPARVIHYTAEGSQEFKVLMFLPAHKPFSFTWEEPVAGLRLYVQRVLIMDRCEALLPGYLRFVKGLVDSSDLPLNISREILQENQLLDGMRKNVVKNVLDGLQAIKNVEYEKYLRFFRELGGYLKEGVATDFANREKLAELLLFESLNTPEGQYLTLPDYVDKMVEGQSEIYYLIGDNRAQLVNSPYVEAYRARNQDVLLLTDPRIDEYFSPSLSEFKGKRLRRIDEGEYTPEGEDKPIEGAEQFTDLLKFIQDQLPEVREVRLSRRLTDSAAVLVGQQHGISPHLAKLLEQFGQAADPEASKRILELNPQHPAIHSIRDLYTRSPDDPRVEIYVRLLYDQAVIAEGSKVLDPTAMARRINELLVKDASSSS